MKMPRFFIFDGCDGTGKTTQLNLLADRLKSLGYNVLVTKALGGDDRNGGDFIQKQLRKLLLSPEFPADRTPIEERLFAVADLANLERAEDFLEESEKNIVISDRGFVSHMAYFMAKGYDAFAVKQAHNELFSEYARLAKRFGMMNVTLIAEDEKMAMERVISRGIAVTPRLENEELQRNVLNLLRQTTDLVNQFSALDTIAIQNVFLLVTRRQNIPMVELMILRALEREGLSFGGDEDAQVVS